MREYLTKTQQAIDLYRKGDFKHAFAIFRRFSFKKEDVRIIEIAHECLSGHAPFYLSLGIDTAAVIQQAKSIISNRYVL